MKYKLNQFTILFTLFAFANAYQNVFPVGQQYSYHFSNDVFIRDFKGGKPIAYRLTGTLNVANILSSDDEKLLKFTLNSPQLNVRPHGSHSQTEFHVHKSPLDNYKNNDFYGIWTVGNITDVYVDSAENVAMVNIKKSIVSLFQYKSGDGDYSEVDATGTCDAVYRATSHSGIRKMKRNCVSSAISSGFARAEQPLQVTAQNHRSTDYAFFADGSVAKVESRDYFHIALEANRKIGGTIDSIIVLESDENLIEVGIVDGKSPKEFLATLKNYKGETLETHTQSSPLPTDANIKKIVKGNLENLIGKNVGTAGSANAFIKILPVARVAEKSDLVQLLKSKKLTENKPQILDILGTAQTINTHEAVKEILDLTGDEEIDNIERYLQALAIGTRPNKAIINDLLKIVDTKSINAKVKTTMIHTLGSMAYRYARVPGHNYTNDVVNKVQVYLIASVSKCKEPSCYVPYLNGLNNLQSPATIEFLFNYANHKERSVSVAATKALRNFPISIWNAKQIEQFEDIFYQKEKRFDSSARTLALDIVLDSKLDEMKLTQLLSYLKSNDRAFEVKKYLLEKIQMLCDERPEVNEIARKIIRNDRTLNNYHIVGQKGLTTALSRKCAVETPFNGTLTSIQEIFGGILKRGLVQMTIDTPNNKYNYFALGLYSNGLSSFVSSNSDEVDETDENDKDNDLANAGMEITVQGSYLRPLEFFRGQGELMGHVWSGTASEPTPAYVASSLLHDHHEVFQLQNGATVFVDVVSALSIDLNGAIQLSLWNRNAQIQVNKNIGLVVSGKILVNAGFVTLDLNFKVQNEPKLNLNTDVDFSAENLLCMQLSQPNDALRYEVEKNQIIPEVRHHVKTVKKLKFKISGFTHYLNKKNNDMCNTILAV